MAAKICNYYAGSNSARGLVSYFEDNIRGIDNLYILKDGSEKDKSLLIKKLGINWFIKGYDIEFVHCPSDENEVEAVIIPALNIAVVDGDSEHISETRALCLKGEMVSLTPEGSGRALSLSEDLILQIKRKIQDYYKSAYAQFQTALSVHDEWEKVYIDNIDFDKLNKIADSSITKLFGKLSLNKESIIKNRFFGGSTYKGAVNFVMDLTKDIGKRYFIKGRPGSGKSTYLKKIASAAQERGFDVEVYHCSFDPQSLDMVIVRELDFAVFDSTAPHEFLPTRNSDEVVDIYDLAITPGTDEKYKDALSSIVKKYKEAVESGVVFLGKAKELQDQVSEIIKEKINSKSIDDVYNELIKKINAVFDNMGANS